MFLCSSISVYVCWLEPCCIDTLPLLQVQGFYIICSISITWPPLIARMQGVLASIVSSGTSGGGGYSPSCMFAGAESYEQAKARLLFQIFEPVITLLIVLVLYSLHWLWRQRRNRVAVEAGTTSGSTHSRSGDIEQPKQTAAAARGVHAFRKHTHVVGAAQQLVKDAARTKGLPLRKRMAFKLGRIWLRVTYIVKDMFSLDFR
jgi:hypothetical protein